MNASRPKNTLGNLIGEAGPFALPMVSIGEKANSLRGLAESGRVSATRTDTGDYQIDPAELGQGRATEQDATALLAETALLQAQIDNLRQMGELLRNELEHLTSQADRLLLTQSAPAAPAKLAGWLRRLAG